jgi:hypothetical protein
MMKPRAIVFALLCAAPVCLAQATFTKALTANYERYKTFLNDTAQAMPEADYDYKLSPAQRPFGEWIEHTALLNYNNCANIKGVPPPPETKTVMGLTGKAAISKALAESFAYCDAALKDLDDAKAVQELTIGERKTVPAQVLVGLVASLNEHYGNLVGYLRTKGLTPPSTLRAQQQKKK